MSERFGAVEPLFDEVRLRHDHVVRVTDAERAVMAAAAARYPEFEAAAQPLCERALRWCEAMEWKWSIIPRREPDPADVPLEVGTTTSIAYAFEQDGQQYVLRYPNLLQNPIDQSIELSQGRLLALARADVHDIPRLERLRTYSLAQGPIITTRMTGPYTEALTPDQIAAIPRRHLEELLLVGTRLTSASLVLDVDTTTDTNVLNRGHAAYDRETGPGYFDYLPAEEEGINFAPGDNFAQLAQALVPLPPGYDLDLRISDIDVVAPRIIHMARAYEVLEAARPDDAGLDRLARTAYLLSQHLEGIDLMRGLVRWGPIPEDLPEVIVRGEAAGEPFTPEDPSA